MTKKCSFSLRKLTVSIIVFLFGVAGFAADNNTNWIVAAEQFESTQNKTDSISNALVVDIPGRILEKLGNSLFSSSAQLGEERCF